VEFENASETEGSANNVTFKCDQGYKLSGAEKSHCFRNNRTWSSNPSCQRKFSVPVYFQTAAKYDFSLKVPNKPRIIMRKVYFNDRPNDSNFLLKLINKMKTDF